MKTINFLLNNRLFTKPLRKLVKVPEKMLVKGAYFSPIQGLYQSAQSTPDLFQRFQGNLVIITFVYLTLVKGLTAWFNYSMPEKQRKLAAAMALTNGLAQVGLAKPISDYLVKKSGKWSKKLFKSLEHDPKNYKLADYGFRSLITISLAGVMVQKLLAPLIATPTGVWLQEKVIDKAIKKHEDDALTTKDKHTQNVIFQKFDKFYQKM